MKRVLILSSEFPPGPGGIGAHAWHVASGLHLAGWQVTVAARQLLCAPADQDRFNQAAPFPVVTLLEARRSIATARRAAQIGHLLRRLQPDVCLVSGGRMIYTAAAPLRLAGVPWLAVEHGWVPRGWERLAKRWSFDQAGAVVAVSQYSMQQLRRCGISPQHMRVIYNGADSQRFRVLDSRESAVCRSLGIGDDAQVLVTVGSVSPRKGQEVMVRAMPKVLERCPTAHYVCAGARQGYGEFVEGLARELGVEERVHLAGVVPAEDVVPLLNRADLFVMTSRHAPESFEGFGIAVVEAALCGVPAVVSGDSGLTEAVADGASGLVARLDDPQDTARAVCELLADSERRRRMGARARERALAEFDWQRAAGEYAHELDELLMRHRAHAS